MLYWESPRFAVEAIQKFSPNVVIFQLKMGEQRWYTIGCYLAKDNASKIEIIVAMLRERPWGTKLLVVGDFNLELAHPEKAEGDEDIEESLASAGLEDILAQLLPQKCPRCQ